MRVQITIKGTDDEGDPINISTDDIDQALDMLMLLNGELSKEDLKP